MGTNAKELVLRPQLRYLHSTEPRLVEMLECTPRTLVAETIVRLSILGFLYLTDQQRVRPSGDPHRARDAIPACDLPVPNEPTQATGASELRGHFSPEQLLGMVRWDGN